MKPNVKVPAFLLIPVAAKKLPGLQKKENEKKLTLNVTSVNIFAIGLWAQSLISGYNK